MNKVFRKLYLLITQILLIFQSATAIAGIIYGVRNQSGLLSKITGKIFINIHQSNCLSRKLGQFYVLLMSFGVFTVGFDLDILNQLWILR